VKGCVLIVDDDVDVIATFAKWLKLDGYDVRSATDGQAAIGQVEGADAIILDARMPILDGLGLLKLLRARRSRVPVAIVTGDYLIDEGIFTEFRRLNARVLFKPLWVDDLAALARELLQQESLV
jgi:DNA-binding NtrC family response regulator